MTEQIEPKDARSELAVSVDAPAGRKLASIVAIDVAGYSRRTEADEDAAIKAVTAMRELIVAAAARHGGRVFNTAGDGFMLEFPAASAALAAAEEIAAGADPPVRIGVHVGEISSTPGGDLLGHGVNVTARLQQMASPGAILASGDVKRAIRGPLADRLKPQGVVRLEKMSEVVPVFALAPPTGGRAKGRRLKPPLAPIVSAVAVLVVAALGAWIVKDRLSAEPAASRIAILPFVALGQSPSAQAFAQGLADQLQGVLNANSMQTISAEDAAALHGPDRDKRIARLGVKLLFDGDVKEEGGDLQVGVRLEDARQHVTLWTADLSGKASQPEALEAQAGGKIVSVLSCARRALKPKGGLADPDALSLYLKACDLFVASPGGSTDASDNYRLIESLRQAVAKAPGFAPARAALAKYLAWYAPRMPAERQAAMRAEAKEQADRVLAADRTQPDAYLALERLQSWRDYSAREGFLNQALAVDPDSSNANAFMAQLRSETGRTRSGMDYDDRAATFDPFCLCTSNFLELAESGQTAAANAQLARFQALYPHLPAMWRVALATYRIEGDWPAYDAMLKDRSSWPPGFTDKDAAMARLLETALRTGSRTSRAEAREMILGDISSALPIKISELARLGFVDDAFGLADGFAHETLTVFNNPTFLFAPDTASLRRDPRFMDLAAKLGMVAYWRKSGIWPDFCADPKLPYDCKVAAAKSASSASASPAADVSDLARRRRFGPPFRFTVRHIATSQKARRIAEWEVSAQSGGNPLA